MVVGARDLTNTPIMPNKSDMGVIFWSWRQEVTLHFTNGSGHKVSACYLQLHEEVEISTGEAVISLYLCQIYVDMKREPSEM